MTASLEHGEQQRLTGKETEDESTLEQKWACSKNKVDSLSAKKISEVSRNFVSMAKSKLRLVSLSANKNFVAFT